MLKVISPVTYVSIAVRKMLGALTMYFACEEISLIPGFVWPYENALAVHVVIFKITLIELTRICKVILPIPIKLPVNKIAFIVASFKLEPSVARFFPIDELSGIFDFIIVPALATVPMLLVVEPFPLIHGPIGVNKYPIAVCFAHSPVTLVDVRVCVSHSALTVEKSIFGHSLVSRTIRKNNYT